MPPILFVAISLQSITFLMFCSGYVKADMVIAVQSLTFSGVVDKNDGLIFDELLQWHPVSDPSCMAPMMASVVVNESVVLIRVFLMAPVLLPLVCLHKTFLMLSVVTLHLLQNFAVIFSLV